MRYNLYYNVIKYKSRGEHIPMSKKTKQDMNIFQRMYKSVYDFKSYIKFSKLSIGKGMVYLLILSIVLGAVMAGKQAIATSGFTKEFKSTFDNNIKEMNLSDNTLTVNNNSYEEIKTKQFILMLDTGNEKTVEDLRQYQTGLLLQKDSFYLKPYGQDAQHIKYDTLPIKELDKQGVMEMAQQYGTVLLYGPFISYPITLFFRAILYSLIIGALGLVIGKAFVKVDTKFAESYNLAMYTITPIYLLTLVLFIFGWYSGIIIDVAIGCLYMYNAYKQIAITK